MVYLLTETELFHATNKDNMNSFVNGIDLNKTGKNYDSAGEIQGNGFYLWKNKKSAIQHAKNSDHDILIIVDKNITSEEFDIDYELGANIVREFLHNNIEKIRPISKKVGLNITPRDGKDFVSFWKGGKKLVGLGDLGQKTTDTSIGSGETYYQIINKIHEYDHNLFLEFEKFALAKCDALKYNGKDKIFPLRIEDLEGNILWDKSKKLQENDDNLAETNHAEYAIGKLKELLKNKQEGYASEELIFRTKFVKLFGGYDKIIHNKKFFKECVDFVISGTNSSNNSGHIDTLNQIRFDYSIHSEKNEFDSILDRKFKEQLSYGLNLLKKDGRYRDIDVDLVIKEITLNLISSAAIKHRYIP